MGYFVTLPFNYCTNQELDHYHLSQWQSMAIGYLQPATMVTNCKVDQSVSCIDFQSTTQLQAMHAEGQTEQNGEYMDMEHGLFSRQKTHIKMQKILLLTQPLIGNGSTKLKY